MTCKTKLGDYDLEKGVQKKLSKVVAEDGAKRFYENTQKANIKV